MSRAAFLFCFLLAGLHSNRAAAEAGTGGAEIPIFLTPTALVGVGFAIADIAFAVDGNTASRSYGIVEAILGVPVLAVGVLFVYGGISLSASCGPDCSDSLGPAYLGAFIPITFLGANMLIHGLYQALRERDDDVPISLDLRVNEDAWASSVRIRF